MIPWTLEELRARAERDLRDPQPGVLLDWSFLAAEAGGAVTAAKEWAHFNEHRYLDIKGTVSGKWAPDEESARSKDLHRQLAELEQALSTARGELAYAETVLRAVESVVRLLERAKLKRKEAVK